MAKYPIGKQKSPGSANRANGMWPCNFRLMKKRYGSWKWENITNFLKAIHCYIILHIISFPFSLFFPSSMVESWMDKKRPWEWGCPRTWTDVCYAPVSQTQNLVIKKIFHETETVTILIIVFLYCSHCLDPQADFPSLMEHRRVGSAKRPGALMTSTQRSLWLALVIAGVASGSCTNLVWRNGWTCAIKTSVSCVISSSTLKESLGRFTGLVLCLC